MCGLAIVIRLRLNPSSAGSTLELTFAFFTRSCVIPWESAAWKMASGTSSGGHRGPKGADVFPQSQNHRLRGFLRNDGGILSRSLRPRALGPARLLRQLCGEVRRFVVH